MTVRIMLVDDNLLYRQALHMLLDLQEGMEVVAELEGGTGILQVLEHTRPEVVCMDISMQGHDGMEMTRQLLLHQPQLKIIGLSAHSEGHYATDMLDAGARGYVVKGGTLAELLRAIHTVSAGAVYVDPSPGIRPAARGRTGTALPPD